MILVERASVEQTRRFILQAQKKGLSVEEKETLSDYLVNSTKLYIGTIEGHFCCAWGLIPPSLLSDRAYLWLWYADEVESHKFTFIRRSQIVVKEILEEYSVIVGFCEIANPRAKRWLEWLGATFGNPIGKFFPFEIRKS